MEDSILVNVGTGSQVSVWTPRPVALPSAEARPCMDGAFLLVGSSLCGGRAFAALEKFYREAAELAGGPVGSLYDGMERQAEACLHAPGFPAPGRIPGCGAESRGWGWIIFIPAFSPSACWRGSWRNCTASIER